MDVYLAKVNKVMFRIIALGVFVCFTFAVLGIFNTFVPTIALVAALVLSLALKSKENGDELIEIINLISIFITFSAIMIDKPEMAVAEGCLSICGATIYFRKRVALLYGAGVSAVISYIYLIKNSYTTETFVIGLSCILFVSIVLFFITKWGSELVIDATNKEKQAKEYLENMKKTMKIIKKNTS